MPHCTPTADADSIVSAFFKAVSGWRTAVYRYEFSGLLAGHADWRSGQVMTVLFFSFLSRAILYYLLL